MKIAALQTVSGTGVAANLEAAGALLAQAAQAGAELAVLPEYFCLMGRRDRDKLEVRERFGDGPIQSFLAQRARALGLWVVGGTLPLVADSDQHVRNTSLVFSVSGRVAPNFRTHGTEFGSTRPNCNRRAALVTVRWRSLRPSCDRGCHTALRGDVTGFSLLQYPR